ncbi:hypothetical protein GBA52_022685 [Prunus armeniaca]|nr:hypothetical protein GBA52_022685 [Prunus armeniaca]
MEATMNLDEHCKIGGSIYKGTMHEKVLALKRTKGDIKEELNILQKVNHVNLVSFLGTSCETDGTRFLVYEYAENGSLEKWLHPNSAAASSSSSAVASLTWSQRIHIALEVANGLQYMHDHTQPSIVHWDLRAKNILQNSNFKAKIANFSMARTVADPMMPKVDVFAFGVVLLELLSGKKALETKDKGEIFMLCKELMAVLKNEEERVDRLIKWMDPKLENCYPIDRALSLADLAWTCTQEKALARPKMAEGKISRKEVAQICVAALESPYASGKTFEVKSVVPFSEPFTVDPQNPPPRRTTMFTLKL